MRSDNTVIKCMINTVKLSKIENAIITTNRANKRTPQTKTTPEFIESYYSPLDQNHCQTFPKASSMLLPTSSVQNAKNENFDITTTL